MVCYCILVGNLILGSIFVLRLATSCSSEKLGQDDGVTSAFSVCIGLPKPSQSPNYGLVKKDELKTDQ